MNELNGQQSAPTNLAKAPVSAPEPQKQHAERTGWRKLFPQVVVDNATRISNAGLFFFTTCMLYSGYRGKQISQDIYDAQLNIIKQNPALKGEALAKQVKAWTSSGIIKQPGWHRLRLAYLLTAMTSFAFGALYKRKEEKPEDLERYSQMSLPEYMRTRTQEALNPAEHSRQTVGVLAGASGVLAVTSALTQPGGIHKSELYVGSLLAVGGAFLAYLKDAVVAQQVFTTAWMLRFPAIITGTKESIKSYPAYKNPFVAEMKQSPEYFKGVEDALRNGYPEDILLGLKKTHRTGTAAVRAYDKGFGTIKLPYERKDYSYPFGQWGNFVSAFLGIVGKKPAAPKVDTPAAAREPAKDEGSKPDLAVASAQPHAPHTHTAHHAGSAEHGDTHHATTHEAVAPGTKVVGIEKPDHAHGRINTKELAAQQMSA